MKQKRKERIAIVTVVVMLGCTVNSFSQPACMEMFAAEKQETAPANHTDELQSDMTNNLNAQNYHTYGNLVSSYLVEEEGGYMRVQFAASEDPGSPDDASLYEAKKDLLVLEYYDEQFQLKTQKYIDEEKKLESLAGFYAGSDNYYVVWKQNLDEKNWTKDQVFMRVIQYDKTWQIQGLVDLTSENGCFCKSDTNGGVVYPCEAGSLRMTEYGGHLYINSCYKGVDGHQRSMMFDIVESVLSPVQADYALAYYYASVSHSYNQFLLVDEELSPERMVTLNHGDGGDYRGSALGQYELDTEYKTVSNPANKEITTLPCVGGESAGGNVRNYTGASLGGMERSETSYLVAGNSIDQKEETFLTSTQRNIFVTATSRTDFTIENTKKYWLTNYAEGAGIEISTPQLVKMSDDLFLVMWREGKQIPHETGKLMYTFLDADGRPQGETKTAAGEITDCKPVVKEGKAVWYSSSGDEGVYFYTIDSRGTFEAHGVNTVAGVPAVSKVELQKEGVYLEWKPVEGADGYCIVRNIKPENTGNTGAGYVEVLTNYELTYIEDGSTCSYLDESEYIDGFPYEYRICSYKICNGRRILSYGCDKIERWLFKGVQYFSAIENTASGVKLSWKPYNPYFNPSEFRIYRSKAGETDAELIQIVEGAADRYSESSVESVIDTTAESGIAYDYSIETRRDEGVSARFITTSFVRVDTPQVSAVCNPDNTVTVSWSKASGAEKYYLRSYIWDEARQKYMEADPEQNMRPDNLSCTVSGLQKGTRYQFGVIGKSEMIQTPSMTAKYGFDSEEAKAEITTYENPTISELQTPSFKSADNTGEGMKLAWDPIEGADGYEITIYNSAQGLKKESVTDTVYVNKNVTEGASYMYQIRAYAQKGGTKTYSGWSETKNVTYRKPAPTVTPVLKPTATPAVKSTATPAVSPTATPAVKPTVTPVLKPTATPAVKPTATPALVPTLTPEVKIPAPNLKSLTCFRGEYGNGIELTWEPVEGADGYVIFAYEDGVQILGQTINRGDTTSHRFYNMRENATYLFYMAAYKDIDSTREVGDSSEKKSIVFIPSPETPDPSPEVPTPDPANTPDPGSTDVPKPSPTETAGADALAVPRLVDVKCVSGGVEITWEASEGADGYFVKYYNVKTPEAIQTHKLEGRDTVSYVNPYGVEGETYVYSVAAYRSTPVFEVGGYSESRSVLCQTGGTSSPISPQPTVKPGPMVKPEPTVKPQPTKELQLTAEAKVRKPGKPAIKKLKNIKGKKVTITLSKKVSGVTGYQAAYAEKSSMKGQKIKSFKGIRVTVKGLKKKKIYYFRVRAYTKRNGKTVYGNWGKVKKIKIKK